MITRRVRTNRWRQKNTFVMIRLMVDEEVTDQSDNRADIGWRRMGVGHRSFRPRTPRIMIFSGILDWRYILDREGRWSGVHVGNGPTKVTSARNSCCITPLHEEPYTYTGKIRRTGHDVHTVACL